MNNDKFKLEELNAWEPYGREYFIDILNKEKDLDEAINDLNSFRNTKFYTGPDNKYKLIKKN